MAKQEFAKANEVAAEVLGLEAIICWRPRRSYHRPRSLD